MGNNLTDTIISQTEKALWEVKNVIDCVPEELWDKCYCEMPMWQHIYHTLHSLDLWYINPNDKNYAEPSIHRKNLNNLDIKPDDGIRLSRVDINNYYDDIKIKIDKYLSEISDNSLLERPADCVYDRFTLILAQIRHLHTHMGMIMGFIIDDTGLWPRVLGLRGEIPLNENYDKYF